VVVDVDGHEEPDMLALVIEDDPDMASVLRRGLGEEGWDVDVATTGQAGLQRVLTGRPDVVVLDLGLPGLDGLTVLARARECGRQTRVLVLTARDGVDDRVKGLDQGADDYVVKPFAFAELLARLRALTRRDREDEPVELLVVGDLELDPAGGSARCAGRPLFLSATELALLECFMREPGRVLSRQQLLDHAWDPAFAPASNVVDVYVGYLRAKVDRPFGRHSLQTVRGLGYRLVRERAPE
jgi:two-component system, OmpR family, response regulator